MTSVKAMIGQNTWPLSLCLYPLLGSLNLTPNLTLGSDLDDDEDNEDDGDDDHDDNPDHQEARGPGGGGVHLLSRGLGLLLSVNNVRLIVEIVFRIIVLVTCAP